MSDKRDSIQILSALTSDICVSVEVLRDYENGNYPNREEFFRCGIYRLCLQTIILNCAKYTEFCREYGCVIRECCPELQKLANQVKSQLEARGVNTARNKFIAHNRCKKNKRPLSVAEIDKLVINVMGSESALPFIEFLFPQDLEGKPKKDYLVGILETIKDRIGSTL